MYRLLFSLILTRLDPEFAHTVAFRVIRALPVTGVGQLLRRFLRPDASLRVTALGTTFPSPFGVAAGFDKEGLAIRALGQLGFGHVEVGTLTARAQPGNERPRMFRLVADRAVINRMGFNNHGSAAAASRLEREMARRIRPVIGANIGKSRVVEVDDAIDDYLQSTRLVAPHSDYLAVNVSSPNTPGLRGLQEIDRLAPLLSAVRDAAGATPVLVKIAPDLSDDEVRRIAALAVELGLAGVIGTNTTISREGLRSDPATIERIGAGGLSGAPVRARSLEVLHILREELPETMCVISVGGVETAADVMERLDAGATLVQGYTGFIYRGPLWAAGINRALKRAGYRAATPRTGAAES
ncbi:dihydroorotate oxidase A [Homoserinimonas aerilata]|uniref:Dihydroorotate dehydrogenase (quinone) n=1 Tax=Homoserinimonas aerilata TaxID=1162970 RepID=A0A542YJ78_9MICO|nr:quinone-dependent dihydroorotate dehydrogenase [Homoserinimonas aerilata]TQL48137.1 dihydroorotate oxidase A [Homoserinimonas aerilata]